MQNLIVATTMTVVLQKPKVCFI